MVKFITDVRTGETEIPAAIFTEQLRIVDLYGKEIYTHAAPIKGWTHMKLVSLALAICDKTEGGADALLGDTWVGSTEV